MTEKDNPQIQRTRLKRLLQEIKPEYEIVFKDSSSRFLKFRIDDEKGTPVGVLRGEYHTSVIADKSDRQVKNILLNVIVGK